MKKVIILASVILLSMAAYAQSSNKLSAEEYYRQAEEHKQTALRLQEEAKFSSEVNSAPDGTTKRRAASHSNSRHYMIKQEWSKYEELKAMGDAVANADKKSEAQKLKDLKEILGVKEEPKDTIQAPQVQ